MVYSRPTVQQNKRGCVAKICVGEIKYHTFAHNVNTTSGSNRVKAYVKGNVNRNRSHTLIDTPYLQTIPNLAHIYDLLYFLIALYTCIMLPIYVNKDGTHITHTIIVLALIRTNCSSLPYNLSTAF